MKAALAGRVRTFAVAAIAATILIVPSAFAAPSAQANGSSKLFGLNYSFKELTGNDAQKIAQSGTKTLRRPSVWPRIEGKQGVFNWSASDKLVGDLAAEGIRVIPAVWGSPKWVAKSAVTAPSAHLRRATLGGSS